MAETRRIEPGTTTTRSGTFRIEKVNKKWERMVWDWLRVQQPMNRTLCWFLGHYPVRVESPAKAEYTCPCGAVTLTKLQIALIGSWSPRWVRFVRWVDKRRKV